MWMILTSVLYLFEIGCIVLAAWGLTIAINWGGKQIFKGKYKLNCKKICMGITIVLLLGVVWFAYHPIVLCPAKLRGMVTEMQIDEIKQVQGGFYSGKLPLYALFIRVESIDDDRITATTQYFPTGRRTVVYVYGDGISSSPLY